MSKTLERPSKDPVMSELPSLREGAAPSTFSSRTRPQTCQQRNSYRSSSRDVIVSCSACSHLAVQMLNRRWDKLMSLETGELRHSTGLVGTWRWERIASVRASHHQGRATWNWGIYCCTGVLAATASCSLTVALLVRDSIILLINFFPPIKARIILLQRRLLHSR